MRSKTRSRDRGDLHKILCHPRLIWLWFKRYGRVGISREHIKIHFQKVSKMKIDGNGSDPVKLTCRAIDLCSRSCYHAQYLYLVCHRMQPRIVVETGVHYGASSAFMLKALNESGGQLYSIDLPNVKYQRDNGKPHSDILPSGTQPGFVVPVDLKINWHLALGDSREKLPDLLRSIGEIDLFLHDSAHTYDLMMFEFETAWPCLRDNGLMVADDADWNDAFKDFCSRHSVDFVIRRGIGITRKPCSANLTIEES